MWQVCCAAFAAVVALLVRTQRNSKFYTLALQGATKGAPPVQLWHSLMDTQRSLTFSVESVEGSAKHLTRASSVVNALKSQIRGGKKSMKKAAGLETLDIAQSTLSAKIAPSQYILSTSDEANVDVRMQGEECSVGIG